MSLPVPLLGFAALVGVAATAGAMIVAVISQRPRWIPPLAFGLLFSNLCVIAVDLFGAAPPVAMLPYILLVLPAIEAVTVRRLPLMWTPTMTAMVLFGVAATISTVLAPRPAGAVATLVQWLLEGVTFFFAALNSVRDRRALRACAAGTALAAMLVALMVVRQYRQSNYYDTFWGLAQVTDPYDITGGSNPLADGSEAGTFRSAGMLGEPNFFAMAMVTVLPWLVYLATTTRSRVMRVVWPAGAVGVLFAIFLSYSRGALVAMVGVVVMLSVLGVLPRRTLVGLAVGGAAAVAVVPSLAERALTLRSALSSGSTSGEASLSGRMSEVLAAVDVFVSHPMTGVGPGQFPEYYQQYAGLRGVGVHFGEGPRNAHNLAAGLASDLGVLGLIAFGLLLGVTLAGLRRAQRTELRPEATAALVSVLLYLACSVFLHLAYARYLWLLLSLAAIVIAIADRALASGRRADA